MILKILSFDNIYIRISFQKAIIKQTLNNIKIDLFNRRVLNAPQIPDLSHSAGVWWRKSEQAISVFTFILLHYLYSPTHLSIIHHILINSHKIIKFTFWSYNKSCKQQLRRNSNTSENKLCPNTIPNNLPSSCNPTWKYQN